MIQSFLETLQRAWPFLIQGFQITIEIWAISIVIGIVVGLFSCLMKISRFKVLNLISNFYIWLIRGTPMIVQALVVYFGMPQVIPGFHPTPFMAGIITLSLNAGAYLSEIFRSGIQAVPKGQTEAARSLGRPHYSEDRSAAGVQDCHSAHGEPVYHYAEGHFDPDCDRTGGDREQSHPVCIGTLRLFCNLCMGRHLLSGVHIPFDDFGTLYGKETEL